ncbi:DUF192 domain-containing protein [Candidatus Microgenomates bacterium]|nr:DUF192 domain-containing protein [Candidatus Microgenomates bacterium]
MKNKLFLPVLIFIALTLAGLIVQFQLQIQGKKVITMGKAKITVEIADTTEKKVKGLSGRPSLGQNEGMLFVFPQKSAYSFWMKDMKFPLDFIWINGSQVVDITKNVPYPQDSGQPPLVSPKAVVDKVLEVNAGVADSSGIQIGDTIVGF